jgi:hypothetical protein
MKQILFAFLATILLATSAHAAESVVSLALASPDFKDGDTLDNKFVFNGFGCTGDNVAPALTWSGAPIDTKYFALTMYDPDAPTGSGWWHWVVINIPADTKELYRATLPEGAIETRTDYNTLGYGGPCPPVGDKPHRYIFRLVALKDKIPLEADVPAAMAGFYINSLKIAESTLTATYGR